MHIERIEGEFVFRLGLCIDFTIFMLHQAEAVGIAQGFALKFRGQVILHHPECHYLAIGNCPDGILILAPGGTLVADMNATVPLVVITEQIVTGFLTIDQRSQCLDVFELFPCCGEDGKCKLHAASLFRKEVEGLGFLFYRLLLLEQCFHRFFCGYGLDQLHRIGSLEHFYPFGRYRSLTCPAGA